MAWVFCSSFRFIRILFWSAAWWHEMNFTVLDVVGQSDFGDLQSLSLFDHGFIQVIHFFHLFNEMIRVCCGLGVLSTVNFLQAV